MIILDVYLSKEEDINAKNATSVFNKISFKKWNNAIKKLYLIDTVFLLSS
jgi:hypothetical protein